MYIPPFKLAQMKKDAAALEKGSKKYQRLAWDALRKSINGLINKVNASNIKVGGWVGVCKCTKVPKPIICVLILNDLLILQRCSFCC